MPDSGSKYRCVIIDDEPHAIEVLQYHMESFTDYSVEAVFTDGFSGLAWIRQHAPDLIFLDIQMPGINGIDVLRNLDQKSAVFLTTAYRHYAPEAFEFEVLDYLMKPISAERLRKGIRRFEEIISRELFQKPDEFLVIRANRSDIRLSLSEVLYFEAMGDYVKCHTHSQDFLTKESMKSLKERLPASRFRQIHRSYIVNLDHVSRKSAAQISLGKLDLPVSRSFRY